MSLERWRAFRFDPNDPFPTVIDVQAHMNRVFDDLLGLPARPRALGERLFAPAIDMYETKDELVITAELPGVKEQDIQLSIVENVLSLRGQRLPAGGVKEEHYHRIERWSGHFERHMQLPIPVQQDKVRASYRDGVLEVHLPKVEEVKPREIKIEVG
jgi:HSP20 family protein